MRRLVLFLALLGLVAGGAAGLGAATRGPDQPARESAMSMHDEATGAAAHVQANGLETSAGGFTFEAARTSFEPGPSDFRFRILDAKGSCRNRLRIPGVDPWMPGDALERSKSSALASIEGGDWPTERRLGPQDIQARTLTARRHTISTRRAACGCT